jgi:hypothetical protein
MSSQSTQLTSPISPDEMVIRSRGRRRFPSSFSPESRDAECLKVPRPTRSSSAPNYGPNWSDLVRIRTFLRKGVRKRSELPAQSPIWLCKVVKTGFLCLKQHESERKRNYLNQFLHEDIVQSAPFVTAQHGQTNLGQPYTTLKPF